MEEEILILEVVLILEEQGEIFLVLEIQERVTTLKVILMLVLIDKENLEHKD